MAVFTKGLYNCACARTVCDWSCTTYVTMTRDLVPNTVVGYVPPLQKTNADRIRAMTDEELAELMEDKGDCPPIECPHDGEGAKVTRLDCKACWLDWLKQEVKNGN